MYCNYGIKFKEGRKTQQGQLDSKKICVHAPSPVTSYRYVTKPRDNSTAVESPGFRGATLIRIIKMNR
jgi:hypothetical protein